MFSFMFFNFSSKKTIYNEQDYKYMYTEICSNVILNTHM